MRPDALARRWARCEASAVVATVGTTSTSSVDPVPEIAALCAEAPAPGCTWTRPTPGRRWSAPENRWAFAGVEQADSLVVNPHKWLFTPIDCSLSVHQAAGGPARGVQPRPGIPARERGGRDEPDRLRPGARPPLSVAQALGGHPLLRPRGPAGASSASTSAPGAAVRLLGGGDAGVGGRGAGTRSRSSASAATAPTRRTRPSSSG